MSSYEYKSDILDVTILDRETGVTKTVRAGSGIPVNICEDGQWDDVRALKACQDGTCAHPKTWIDDYVWSEGNNSCDCNRYHMFYPEEDENGFEHRSCGNSRFVVLSVKYEGREIYSEVKT